MELSLWALFASSFVSATILPGNSEIVLLAVLKAGGASPALAVAVATVGNTLGGMTTYAMGRAVPSRLPAGRAVERTRRYGPALLLLSWVPVAGDAFCAAAGWLRLPWPACLLAMAAGKLARYLVVAQAAQLF